MWPLPGLKTRKKVQVIDGWQRLFPQGARTPFPRGTSWSLVEAGRHDLPTYEAQSAGLTEAIDRRGVHRLVRAYVALAVENILEAHESVEAEVGPLRLLVVNPETGTDGRRLTAWAPLYTTDDGIREIEKFGSVPSGRMRRACLGLGSGLRRGRVSWRARAPPRAGHRDRRRGREPEGLVRRHGGRGPISVVAHGRDLARAVADDDHVVPATHAGTARAAGSCRALVSVERGPRAVGQGLQFALGLRKGS